MSVASGAASGAATGATFGPWGAAIGAVAGGIMGSSEESSGSGSGGSPMGSPESPSISGFFVDSRMSNSGWVVSTGRSKAAGYSAPTDSGIAPSLTAASGMGLVGSVPGATDALPGMSWTTLALIAFALVLVLRK